MRILWRWLLILLVCLLAGGRPSAAAVERVEVLVREPFAGGKAFGATGVYERIKGRLHYALDPDDPANALIVDLHLAPVDQRGLVTFAGDFILLRPLDPGRGNRTLLYEVNNRGGLGLLPMFVRAARSNNPRTLDHAGDGLLFEQGYTLLWSAWNWDVIAGGDRLLIDLPIAAEGGRAITGPVAAEFVPSQPSLSAPFMWGFSKGYPPVDLDDPTAVLTWRNEPGGARHVVPRSAWRFSDLDTSETPPRPTRVTADEPFAPGRIYEVVYQARDPRVVGLGLAAIRDAIGFFRFDDEASASRLDRAIAFGISQSGRVINHMLWQGFHRDEAERMVVDGALVHVAGAGKGSFNHRFAQTTRHPSQLEDQQYPADVFPFTTTPSIDPVTGEAGSMLDRARAMGMVPKIFYTTTSTEYWTRAASLLHTDVEGVGDLPLAAETRLYFFAGAQHGVWAWEDRWPYEHCTNGFDHRFGMRALLPAMQRWLESGEAPPDSVYPTFAAGTLGSVADYIERFPKIPDFSLPSANLAPPRLELGPHFREHGIVDRQPAGFGPRFVTAVPLPDADGIDQGGIRLPGLAAPLATHTGWNLRRAEIGAAGKLARWSGSMLPFIEGEADRAAAGDPRPSLEARYGSREAYALAIERAAHGLVDGGYLLEADLSEVTRAALRRFDKISRHRRNDPSCAYSVADF
ncbi:MAG: alpha/beta hydrolase domain-containing protein [Alphaproteobacteria bacterium]|nr:alpha/beta hydrolase domain-containing protein [Alphaproteobacteria bacterium]